LVSEIPWFTYKQNFDRIQDNENNYKITNDTGWGCQIRVG